MKQLLKNPVLLGIALSAILVFGLTCYETLDLKPDAPTEVVKSCFRNTLVTPGFNLYNVFSFIYGEYEAVQPGLKSSVIINPDGTYYILERLENTSQKIVSHGQITVTVNDSTMTFENDQNDFETSGEFVYCDEILINLDRDIRFLKLCKCTL